MRQIKLIGMSLALVVSIMSVGFIGTSSVLAASQVPHIALVTCSSGYHYLKFNVETSPTAVYSGSTQVATIQADIYGKYAGNTFCNQFHSGVNVCAVGGHTISGYIDAWVSLQDGNGNWINNLGDHNRYTGSTTGCLSESSYDSLSSACPINDAVEGAGEFYIDSYATNFTTSVQCG